MLNFLGTALKLSGYCLESYHGYGWSFWLLHWNILPMNWNCLLSDWSCLISEWIEPYIYRLYYTWQANSVSSTTFQQSDLYSSGRGRPCTGNYKIHVCKTYTSQSWALATTAATMWHGFQAKKYLLVFVLLCALWQIDFKIKGLKVFFTCPTRSPNTLSRCHCGTLKTVVCPALLITLKIVKVRTITLIKGNLKK